MASRMDKYHEKTIDSANTRRSTKNEELYENVYTNKVVTEFTDIGYDNVIDLQNISRASNVNRRENYQKMRYLDQSITGGNDSKNSYEDPLNYLPANSFYKDKEDKNYNVNEVLENARKTRSTTLSMNEEEKNRHLKSVEYSILSDLSQEKVKNHQEKKKQLSKDEEEEVEELIHTITSNSLRKKIDDELLGELMATKEQETLVSTELLRKIEEDEETEYTVEELDDDDDDGEEKMDQSFYTKSMDLSEKDFVASLEEGDDEDDSFVEERKIALPLKILLVVLALLIVGSITFVIYYST